MHKEGKTSSMTLPRIQELESLGFEWDSRGAAWEDSLSELDEYREIHGHCNVSTSCSENAKLGNCFQVQRTQYRLHLEGKRSPMTTLRIQKLESLGFEWNVYTAAWEDRLSELADICKQHGHCNVPKIYSENFKLDEWVRTQRINYRFQLEGKRSQMTGPRIQALESLGFEWASISQGKGTRKSPKSPSIDNSARRVYKTSANLRQGANSQLETAPLNKILRTTGYRKPVGQRHW
jgi:hypothetical protein